MAEMNGKLLICDRCGKQIFLRTTGEGETDGGYTRWNKFEPAPDGWDLASVPECPGAKYGSIRVCPECHALWDAVIYEHFLKGTPYYKEGQHGNVPTDNTRQAAGAQ